MSSFFSKKPQAAFDPIKDLPDLSGKVIIVTGGNSGIGFTTVQQLARKGAKVYIAGRSEARVGAAIERLRAEGLEPGNGAIEWLELDLSDPRKAKESAEKFAAKEAKLDVLVHNAAVMNGEYVLNDDGVIDSMVTNCISPVVFTRALLPLLTKTAREPESDVRIVWVSTAAMGMLKGRDIHFRSVEDLNEKFGMHPLQALLRYANSKLAAFLAARKLQEMLNAEGTPIPIISLHPGVVWTEGLSNLSGFNWPIIGPLSTAIVSRMFLTPAVGAHPSVVAAASSAVKAEREKYKNGFLWSPAGTLGDPPTPQCNDEKLADELWATTEALLKQWDISV
ncbi:NAD(P)-binding protein [Ganoderma leucocontextum]|nr:NAD(P)-binding protein [Ganoderma leucocontextum]